MFESLLAKYYQEDKERLQKTFLEDIRINLKKKKIRKRNNMLANSTKIPRKMKNKSLLSIEENIIE